MHNLLSCSCPQLNFLLSRKQSFSCNSINILHDETLPVCSLFRTLPVVTSPSTPSTHFKYYFSYFSDAFGILNYFLENKMRVLTFNVQTN
jgi:hypothetical protein